MEVTAFTTVFEKAIAFATAAHEGQVRKYTGEPYVEHVIAVAEMVATHVTDDDAIIAAILHDTVEDCDVTIDEIQAEFGDRVAEYVWYLTKPPVFVGNRAKRKALDRARLKEAPEIVRFIKVMDIWHNSTSIREFDEKFYETFRQEVRDLLYIMDALGVMRKFAGHYFSNKTFLPWFGDL